MKKKMAMLLVLLLTVSALAGCGKSGDAGTTADSAKEQQTEAADDNETKAEAETDAAAADGERQPYVHGVYTLEKMDPANGYEGWGAVRYGVCETPFVLDDELNVVANLVENYGISEDKMTWTITFKDGILFHNGNPLDGEAYKADLERVISMNERAAADLMIDSMTADGNTISITTTEPNPTLPNALCDPYAAAFDASAVESVDNYSFYPVGTGPYVPVEYVENDHISLEPFEDYWNGTPAASSLTIKCTTDVDTLAMALQNGEVDSAYGLSYDTLDLFADNPDYEISQAATTRVYQLFFNLNHDFMNDENFRRAICMAVDKQTYTEVLLNGAGTATKSAFPSYLDFGGDEITPDVPDYDPEGALALLNENGYTDSDGDGFLDKDGQKVSIKIVTYGRTGLPQSAQALQSALQQLGIDASFEQFESIESVLTAGEYDICVYAYVTMPTGDPFSYLSFTCGTGNGANFGGYSNEEVDALLAELAMEFDTAKRAELASQIQKIVTSDSSYCYLFHLNMFMATKAGVVGIKQSPVDYYHITVDTARS